LTGYENILFKAAGEKHIFFVPTTEVKEIEIYFCLFLGITLTMDALTNFIQLL
jgi:hypothetical protein